jgi:nitroreductase
MRLLRVDAEGVPEAVPDAAQRCIACGHCVSVCPCAALSLDRVALADCRELPKGWNLCVEQIESLLKGRRSIRHYRPDPLPKDNMEKLIDIARYAPSGVNTQSIRWGVLYEREKVGKLSSAVIGWMRGLVAQNAPVAAALKLENLVAAYEKGDDLVSRGAPHLVYAYALKDDMMAQTTASISLTFFDIAAASAGFGACWAGYMHMALNASPECRTLAGLNSRCACFGAMLCGYPAVTYKRIPPRNKPQIKYK